MAGARTCTVLCRAFTRSNRAEYSALSLVLWGTTDIKPSSWWQCQPRSVCEFRSLTQALECIPRSNRWHHCTHPVSASNTLSLAAQALVKVGFKGSVRDTRDTGTAAAAAAQQAKREEKEARLRQVTMNLALAWGLSAVCGLGHLAHAWGANAPAWLHALHSTPLHAALSVAALIGAWRSHYCAAAPRARVWGLCLGSCCGGCCFYAVQLAPAKALGTHRPPSMLWQPCTVVLWVPAGGVLRPPALLKPTGPSQPAPSQLLFSRVPLVCVCSQHLFAAPAHAMRHVPHEGLHSIRMHPTPWPDVQLSAPRTHLPQAPAVRS